MSNSYVQSSSIFPLKKDQIEKATEIINRIVDFYEDQDSVEFEFEFVEEGLWIYQDENFNPDQVAHLIEELVKELEIDKQFTFSWSYSNSKMLTDSFGGGACSVKRGQETFFTDAFETASNHFKEEKL